jgi:predicted DCC family thiol-disulfide oxidoreductase YuxK
MEKPEALTLFFDGKCILCYREVNHYLKLDKDDLLRPIDISSDHFSADDYGLDEREININMHAMDESGNIFVGVDTFAEIWKRVPYYNKVSSVLENKTIRPALSLGYKVFAEYIRPNLPKRKCDDGSCDLKSREPRSSAEAINN